MGQEDMIDARQFGNAQVAQPGAGVDQDVVVDEQRRGAQVLTADAATTAEDSEFHRHLVFKVQAIGRQGLMISSILTPAISTTSLSSSWKASPSSGVPLTVGNFAPSTWVT